MDRVRFGDRQEAGRALANQLAALAGRGDVVVLALPRGGVPVGFEIAHALGVPLDVFVVRKLGVPGQEELAFGAIASGGVRIIDEALVERIGLSRKAVASIARREEEELDRRRALYRTGEDADVEGKIVILTDDGLATGASMRAAVRALRMRRPREIIVAVPVAPPRVARAFRAIADDLVCCRTPEPFTAVGSWYRDFHQITDDEVRTLLARAAERFTPTHPDRA